MFVRVHVCVSACMCMCVYGHVCAYACIYQRSRVECLSLPARERLKHCQKHID